MFEEVLRNPIKLSSFCLNKSLTRDSITRTKQTLQTERIAHKFYWLKIQKNKRGSDFIHFSSYGRFLRAKMVNRPTTIIATKSPAIAGTKYRSAVDCTGAAVGATVGAAFETTAYVSAYELP